MLEILRQLEDSLHQDFDCFVNMGDGLVEYRLCQLFHFFGKQGGPIQLNHLQGAVHLMQIIKTEAQTGCVIAIVDK